MSNFTESTVESAALDCQESLGWTVKHGPDIAVAECSDANYREVMLAQRLCDTLLPKLLSGEIRVSEAKEAVEETV